MRRIVMSWLTLTFSLFLGCGSVAQNFGSEGEIKSSEDYSKCNWGVSRKQYERDSACIILTAEAWIRKGVSHYDYWFDGSELRDVCISVDTIVYDSTGLKMLSILSFGYDRVEVQSVSNDFPQCQRLYDTRAMIGYLDSVEIRWKLYDPEIFSGIAWCDSISLKEETFRIFFEELPSHRISKTIRDDFGKVVSIVDDLLYSPVHCRFWTNSPLWQKGYRLPQYYSFEVKQNAGPVYPFAIKEEIIVNYPNSLLSAFTAKP
jgi:hypothetical protein